MTEVSGVRRWGSLILSIGLCLAASAIGALATASSVRDWYPSTLFPYRRFPICRERVFIPMKILPMPMHFCPEKKECIKAS